MYSLQMSHQEWTDLSVRTTLGKQIGNSPVRSANRKQMKAGIALLILSAVMFMTYQHSKSGPVLLLIGGALLGKYLYDRKRFNSEAAKDLLNANILEAVRGIVTGRRDEAEKCLSAISLPPGEAAVRIRETVWEVLSMKMQDGHPGVLSENADMLVVIRTLDDVLNTLGDGALNGAASQGDELLSLRNAHILHENGIADPEQYGVPRSGWNRADTAPAALQNRLGALEKQCAEPVQDPLLLTAIDGGDVLRTLYGLARCMPPVSQDMYHRGEQLCLEVFGSGSGEMPQDVLLAQLIRMQAYSPDRVKREKGNVCRWMENHFALCRGNPNFEPVRFARSFCGALKVLGFDELEQACLLTAEKTAGLLEREMTARLDELMRGSVQAVPAAQTAALNGKKKISAGLRANYSTAGLGADEIADLFTQREKDTGSGMDEALALKVRTKNVALPCGGFRLQPSAIVERVNKSAGEHARICTLQVRETQSGEMLNCLSISVPGFPGTIILMDIGVEQRRVRIRTALCWIPAEGNASVQKQQCLNLWKRGGREETAVMNAVLFAAQESAEEQISQWKSAAPQPMRNVQVRAV